MGDTAGLGNASDYVEELRAAYSFGELKHRDNHRASPTRKALIDHPAVKFHGKGVATEDLVNFIDCMNTRVVGRVRGTGAEQYAREQQAFERYGIDRLVEETLDELADVIAYTAMLCIKLLAAVKESK